MPSSTVYGDFELAEDSGLEPQAVLATALTRFQRGPDAYLVYLPGGGRRWSRTTNAQWRSYGLAVRPSPRLVHLPGTRTRTVTVRHGEPPFEAEITWQKVRESNSQGAVNARPGSNRLPSPIGLTFQRTGTPNRIRTCTVPRLKGAPPASWATGACGNGGSRTLN